MEAEHKTDALSSVLMDSQKELSRSNHFKDKIIMLLIILMFVEAVAGYLGFTYYVSSAEYVDTYTTTETDNSTIDMHSEGDGTSATYNDVNGDQYNDNAVHNSESDKGGDE